MRRLVTVTFALLSFACSAVPPENTLDLLRISDENVAIDGYSPVSYFQHGRAEQGSAEYNVQHEGITYFLTGLDQVEFFEADPGRYQPAHGGWCSLMLSGSGQRTPANPESFKIIDDKLLMFWHGDYNGQTISGLKNWASKTDNDPVKEMERLLDADKTWQKILEGRKDSPIVLFNERDKDRIGQRHQGQLK